MGKFLTIASATYAALSLQAATVDSVTVTQDWPWSNEITVTYELSGTGGEAVNVTPTFYSGTVQLPAPEPGAASIKGELCGLRADKTYSFTLDPAKAFPSYKAAIADFKVKLTATAAPANIDEALYRIYDIKDGSCEDVTRADLLNGKYGAYETDYGKIGRGFTTELSDVLIWTGVTNGTLYKTDKLVMRKIHAAGVVWQCGDPEGAKTGGCSRQTQKYIRLTQDFYIGVFELTQYQMRTVDADSSTFPDDCRPAETFGGWRLYGHPDMQYKGVITGEPINWPTNSYLRDADSTWFMGVWRKRTKIEFDVATAAEWEFACRGGNATPLYSGKEQTEANACELGWCNSNAEGSTHPVGEKAPNAFGLYDMLGNVEEYVHNVGNAYNSLTGSGTEDDPYVDPVGSYTISNRMCMGGSWSVAAGAFGYWQDLRFGAGTAWHSWHFPKDFSGGRVVCPATANGQWGVHPVK